MSPGEVTLLLQKADGGDRAAADALYRLVEDDLRAIAGKRKRRFDFVSDGSTTVIVDDAFFKLVGGEVTTWRPGDRAKFFCYVATKIHDQLVENARAQQAQKRGGGKAHADVYEANPAARQPLDESDFIIDLKTALARFEAFAEPEVRAFRLYYFLGCTFDETAELLGVSPTEAKRRCQKAQLWLRRELKGYGHES